MGGWGDGEVLGREGHKTHGNNDPGCTVRETRPGHAVPDAAFSLPDTAQHEANQSDKGAVAVVRARRNKKRNGGRRK